MHQASRLENGAGARLEYQSEWSIAVPSPMGGGWIDEPRIGRFAGAYRRSSGLIKYILNVITMVCNADCRPI